MTLEASAIAHLHTLDPGCRPFASFLEAEQTGQGNDRYVSVISEVVQAT